MQSVALAIAFAVALSLAVPHLTPAFAQQNMAEKKKGMQKKKKKNNLGQRYKNPLKQ